jgi:pimeloyl-ACP methyl ester carboxylesterase
MMRWAGLVYGLSVLLLAVLTVWPGRLGIVSRVGLAPDLIVPTFGHVIQRSADGSMLLGGELPPAERMAIDGRPHSPPLVVYGADKGKNGVVFICPAGGGRGATWAANAWMQLLDDQYAVAGFSYEREKGDSGPFKIETVPALAKAAFATAAARFGDAPFVVVGVSLGGGPALDLAAGNPARVRGLVLDGPGDLKHEIGRQGWPSWCPPLFFLTPAFFRAAVPAALDQRASARAMRPETPVLLLGYEVDRFADPAWLDVLRAEMPWAEIRRREGEGHPCLSCVAFDDFTLRDFVRKALAPR